MSTGTTLQERAVDLLKEKGLSLTLCESCTGGLLASMITEVPGASAVFPGSFVTYSSGQKHRMAGVSSTILRKKGAVSVKSARAMARGAAMRTGADLALSVTGNAGPEPSEEKPVGLVYIGFYRAGRHTEKEFMLEGDRSSIRHRACEEALLLLIEELEKIQGQ